MKFTVFLANGTEFASEAVDVPPMDRKKTEETMARQFMHPASFAVRLEVGGIAYIPQELMRTAIVMMEW